MKKVTLIIFIIFIVFVEKSHSRQYSYSHRHQQHEPIKIGGLFNNNTARMTFLAAIERINNIRRNTPEERIFREISYDVNITTEGNEFLAAKVACDMISTGAVAIIGPNCPEQAVHVRSVCDAKEIPLIETRIDGSAKHVINLHPTPEDLSRVFLDLIHAFNWKGFTILYEDAPWLQVAEYILRNYKNDYIVAVRQLDVTANKNYRPQLAHVKRTDERNIIFSCSIENLGEIMKQAQQVGLLSEEHNIIITSLDMHTIDLEPYQYGGTNITGARLINPHSNDVHMILKDLKEIHKQMPDYEEDEADMSLSDYDRLLQSAQELRLDEALIYDAVLLFSHTMAQHANIGSHKNINCDDPDSTFINGTSIFNSMKTITFKGLSGDIQFDQQGNREDFHLEILELESDGLKKIGTWNSTKKLTLNMNRFAQPPIETDPFKVKTLKVLIVVENEPYAMRKKTIDVLYGNEQFEGYTIELIEKLAARVGFNFTFEMQDDRIYGNPLNDGTGKWNGMIGELMADRADLAITDLTVTSAREEAVDFTSEFMNLGIQILYQKPKKDDPKLFSFLEPFSTGVWACVLGSFLLVSLSLFIMGRMSPAEWDNPFPCIEEPEILLNQFSYKNAIWFTVGAVLQQGSEIAPKAPSTRIVASIWWFFTLIMVSSYTANLAAFLTIENPSPTINNVKELFEKANNKELTYGAKYDGSTITFFRDSSNQMYRDMYEYMQKHPEDLTTTNEKGIEWAETRKYAYLMESSTIEYKTQRHCNVSHVGDLLDSKGYGIAMKKGSPLRSRLSEAILQMQESGELTRMRTKWWREKRGGGACGSEDGGSVADPLGMKNVGGIFVTVAIGCGFAITLGFFRWIVNIWRLSRKFHISFKEAFTNEFRFFKKFNVHVKAVPRKSSSQLDSTHSSNDSHSRGRSRSGTHNENLRLSLKSLNHRGNNHKQFDNDEGELI